MATLDRESAATFRDALDTLIFSVKTEERRKNFMVELALQLNFNYKAINLSLKLYMMHLEKLLILQSIYGF